MPGPMYPVFRRNRNGDLILTDSVEAMHMQQKAWSPPMTAELVEKEAKERVKARKGNVADEKDVLGEYIMQSGKYRGQGFRWLLENVPGYIGWYVGQLIKDEGKEDRSSENAKKNKNSLKSYVMMFEEGRELVKKKRTESLPLPSPAVKAIVEGRSKLPPEILVKRIQKVSSPPKFHPNIPSREDRELVACLQEYESAHPPSPKPSVNPRNVALTSLKSTVKRSIFQKSETTLAPPPRPTTSRKVHPDCVRSEPQEESSPATIHSARDFVQSEPRKQLSPATKPRARDCVQSEPQEESSPVTTPSAQDCVQSEPQEESSPATAGSAQSKPSLPKRQRPQPSLTSSTCVQSESRVELFPSTTHSGHSQPPVPVQTQQASLASSEPLLLEGWKSTLPVVDRQWLSKLFFGLNNNNKVEFKTDRVSHLWYYPPQPSVSTSVRNRIDRYFAHRLFLWMPVNMWSVKLHCPHTDADTNDVCNGILTRAGMHQKTRLVLDIDSFYVIAAEYLRCSECGKKLVSWAHNIISQLDRDRQLLFPCILTARYACDKKVVELLRQRGLGNSSSMVRRQLEESHGDRHLRNVHHYLTASKTFMAATMRGLISTREFEEPPAMTPIPQHRWLMKVYQLDVLHRLDFIKACITSLFGTVLKLDSTKKITKKLAGKSAKTAMWATNVGNEYGQVVMTVLTTSEGHGLADMITGLCRRYETAGVPVPRLLYVDRDCCGNACVTKYFSWPFLLVRLDIWHFMRRLSVGCTTDSHQLYGTFMGRLSHCIFKWEEDDVKLLKKAKRAEMIHKHIPDPSEADVVRHIKADELALHCRRVTRGTQETTTLITQLIQSMEGDKGLDILGVPLFDSLKMRQIWAQQSQHVCCLQDPMGVQLYTRVGTMKKGGVELPKYRCARGSTSLESFHLHMNRFIPGTLASDVNFQVYLLDGVHRWNQDRQREATQGQASTSPLSYDGILRHSVNQLAREVLDKEICPDFTVPGKYTGELIGLEYLYSQSTGASVKYEATAMSMEEDTKQEEDTAEDGDEGFEEPEDVADLTIPALDLETAISGKNLLRIPSDEEYKQLAKDTGNMQFEPQEESSPAKTPTPSAKSETSIPVQRQQTSLSSSTCVSEPGQELSHPLSNSPPTLTLPEEPVYDESDLGPDNIPGYAAVQKLAIFLVGLREQDTGLTTLQADCIIQLWGNLSDYDKARTRFPQRFAGAPGSGRFRSPKKQVALGVTSIERAILGPNSTRSNWPDCNRYVEATVEQLMEAYPSDKRCKKNNSYISRWTLVKEAYAKIQSIIIANNRVMELTQIQLPSLNTKTIQQWFNKKGKERDLKILLQGIQLPQAPMTGSGAPAPKEKPEALQSGHAESFAFVHPPDTAGMAKLKVKKLKPQANIVIDRPILPRPSTPVVNPVVRFPVLLSSTTDFTPLSVDSTQLETVTHTVKRATKRKTDVEQGLVAKRKYTKRENPPKCGKCGEVRIPPAHRQYMGFQFCEKMDTIPFDQWRAELQEKGVARKKNISKL